MSAPSKTLSAVLWTLAAGILVQAGLAGQFISGSADLRWLHEGVGLVLALLALLGAVVALVARVRSRAKGWVTAGAVVLPFVLALQLGLGWAPAPTATAVHVPLGVTLFALTLMLAAASSRPRATER